MLECLKTLNELSTRNDVHLIHVPSHSGIVGNERAD